jgi:hypothetical protein
VKTTSVEQYHKHGCHFIGKLAVIDYSEELDRHPRAGQFGGEALFDVVEDATKFAQERYPGCKVLLSVPELVVRLEATSEQGGKPMT